MYTFLICAAFSLIVAGIIFGKRLRDNIFSTALIVLIGSFIGVSVVNGVLGLRIPFTEVLIKEKHLSAEISRIATPRDTILISGYLEFDYNMLPDSSIKYNQLDSKSFDCIDSDKLSRISRFSIHWLPEGDTIPHLEIWREKRIVTDSKWISSIGIPGGRRLNKIYLPQDSAHIILVRELNDKFFPKDSTNAESQIAYSN
jgi:hypothetical protein